VNKGTLLATSIAVATILLVAAGTIWPVPAAVAFAGGEKKDRIGAASTPQGAVDDLGTEIRLRDYNKAYSSLANKAEFTQDQFLHDLSGHALSLRTYATLDSFQVQPLHENSDTADVAMKLRWSTVVGTFVDTRNLHVVKTAGRWAVEWPIVQEQHVPPQVIAVNYLRWDVISSGSGDDWGAQDVEAPHVRIVDMHPVNRADGVVVLGELLNEDIIPAYVSVRATLIGKNGAVLDSEGSFDMIDHTLLPKQVTPFVVNFPGIDLSQVASIHMDPVSVLVSASADPVVEVQNQTYNPAPNASLTGQLSNQSGQTVNVAHVISSFYDKNGQLVWVAGQYIDRALHPQTPVPFHIPVPEDLAKNINSERTVVATYSSGSSM
jgi:hypothetical protein